MSDILNDEYEPEIIDLEDEEGNIKSFEFIDNLEHNGVAYYALAPFSQDDEDDAEDGIFVILKEQATDNEEEIALVTIDDEEESDTVGDLFIKRFEEAFED